MRTDDDRRRVVVGSLGYAMSFARGTRYDSPLRLCRDIKMRVRMPDRLPYVSTIDSSLFRVDDDFRFLHLSVERHFNGS